MCRRMFLLITVVVFVMSGIAIGEVMEGGPYSPPTDPYAACSRDGFGAQGNDGWRYGYVAHGDTWSHLTDHMIDMDLYPEESFDGDPSHEVSYDGGNPMNMNLLCIDEDGQAYAGGGNAWSTVRYWVADVAIAAGTETGGGVINIDTDSGLGVRAWLKVVDVSAGTTNHVGDIWDIADGTLAYWVLPAIVVGDIVAFGVGHSGADDSGQMRMQNWHQHITPEPATIALLGLGGLFLRRRKH